MAMVSYNISEGGETKISEIPSENSGEKDQISLINV